MEKEFELISIDIKNVLSSISGHDKMLKTINDNLPEIQKASLSFYKSQSQFMDNVLTVSHPTPLRNIRQILAEINKSQMALKEAYFRNKRTIVEIEIINRDIKKTKDKLKVKLLSIDLEQKMLELETSKTYISGAIRKITNYIAQYKSIMNGIGKSSFDELDFEKEEEKYHIKKAFDQAITAARARNGIVDEGNHIYFNQLGINGAVAQVEIIRFLKKEGDLITKGIEVSHSMVTDFLEEMYNKFKGCSSNINKHKLMNDITNIALITSKNDQVAGSDL